MQQVARRTDTGQRAVEQVGAVDLRRLVRRVAEFRTNRPACQGRTETQAVQADVFRVFPAWPHDLAPGIARDSPWLTGIWELR
ncbi:hypothetical protein D3C72_2021170 [compost metagenome]